MLKLKNITSGDLILIDLGQQLLHANETVDLDGGRKESAANSSQIMTLIGSSQLAVIDNDNTQITNISLAIDVLKGFSQVAKQTLDSKIFVQETSRPIGTGTFFTSEGDNMSSATKVGGGQAMKVVHNIGDELIQHIYMDWNFKENLTYIHEGYIMWQGADFDRLSLGIVPTVTTYTSGTNTNYNLVNGYLIIPAAGNGVITPGTINLVECPISRDSGVRDPGYWDADYSTSTHTFSNIRASSPGAGQYNIFAAEISLGCFVNKWLLLESGFLMLQSSDSQQLAHGLRLKLSAYTNTDDGTPDHDWKVAAALTLHRKKISV